MEGCRHLGVRLIPKGLAGFVPISIGAVQERLDGILIDDDALVHMVWKKEAGNKKKAFKGYNDPEEFFAEHVRFHQETPIYVDMHLGNGKNGNEISKKIFDLGFRNIYIATGFRPDDFEQLGHVRSVCGKEPPWC
jgi:hypothetical protein